MSTAQANKQIEEYVKLISTTKGTLYYEHFYTASRKTWFHKVSLSREEIVLVNRLRSNRININESLHRVQMIESSACPCGDPCQTINHFLFHCEKFNLNSSLICNFIANKFPNSSSNLLPFFPLPPNCFPTVACYLFTWRPMSFSFRPPLLLFLLFYGARLTARW